MKLTRYKNLFKLEFSKRTYLIISFPHISITRNDIYICLDNQFVYHNYDITFYDEVIPNYRELTFRIYLFGFGFVFITILKIR